MIFEKLQIVIAEKIGRESEEIKLEANFRNDLEIDSLDLFEIVMGIEDEFGITIPNEDVEKIQTVKDAVDYITAKQ